MNEVKITNTMMKICDVVRMIVSIKDCARAEYTSILRECVQTYLSDREEAPDGRLLLKVRRDPCSHTWS